MAISDEERKRRNAERAREYRKTHLDNKESHRIRQLRYQIRNAGKIKQQRRYIKKDGKLILLKEAVLKHYGNGILACVKCGYSDIDCLTIDHINNDAHHRQNNGRVGGTTLYRKLRKQNYPQGFQTLCINCNFKKSLENLRHKGNNKSGVILEDLPLFRHGGILSGKDVPQDVIKDDN